jgi:flagellar biosynthetic protein FliR
VTLSTADLTVFLLALVRTTAWATTAPIIGTRGTVTATGRLALSLALAVFLTPLLDGGEIPTDVAGFVGAVLVQVAIGLILGWATTTVVSAFLAAGSLIDFMSGFSAATIFDPANGNPVAVFGRFIEVLFTVLLFVTPAHRVLLVGFVRSFEAFPLGTGLPLDERAFATVATAVGQLMLAAIQIAAPVVGALFLTEVALAVASRFVPQANVFLIGLPLKILVALFTIGGVLVFLPTYLEQLVEGGVQLSDDLLG